MFGAYGLNSGLEGVELRVYQLQSYHFGRFGVGFAGCEIFCLVSASSFLAVLKSETVRLRVGVFRTLNS